MSRTAVIVIDMITAYDFPDAERVVPSAEKAVPVIADAIGGHDGPVIYVNDNFGHWRSHRDQLVEEALDAHIRHFEVRVPPDAVAHIHENLADAALQMMERNMQADLTPIG